MKILVIGSKGQLGHELLIQGNNSGYEILPADLPELDITDKTQVKHWLEKFRPSFVVNSAAYTNVDKAETEIDLAFAVNRDGPANLAEICALFKVPLIHISTDFVFDGKKKSPYIESDPASPLSIYGKSKQEGDNEVRARLKNHIILRTAWLYGVHGHNFVKTMLRLGKEKEVINVVADQFGSPTSAADLAAAVLQIISRIKYSGDINWGTYHYCGHGITTWHKFAEEILNLAKHYIPIKTTNVKPISTAEYPTKAVRPPFSALDCGLIKKNFEISLKPWQDSLKTVIRQLCQKETEK
ncbi:MAG: dTDP-4-dehydrorhamnose reductase [Proteobacteria bacterium]|nr:dTDP-4-dehydrorhamnose reductase [Desulfobacteraceae bacterium]MBU2522065.1 dTDP-4-dehydrorhamnose reductase [Pseudomonadota bacterium]MBU3980859.1 dTDP-4-dehydrorhamnose reductase [Pseudomonadota bacterium]MBU4011874.1 dTDP-4-dehydrorhamnose reductase [Pseudomonadota bacterium]MBU4067072.1 dTDP-4-dehydrorhamnose reductase [Pseudomonadota bacterium]